MISAQEATQIVHQTPLRKRKVKLPLAETIGKVLAEPVVADRDFPPYNRVTMDGIALKFDPDLTPDELLAVQSMQFAGDPQQTLLSPNRCIEVMTGAVCPEGADAVVRYEDLKFEQIGDEKWVSVLVPPKKAPQNIHQKGSDRLAGTQLLAPGVVIGPPEIAVAASVGMANLMVTAFPKIAVISTGNELVEVSEIPLPHQIRTSNVQMIRSALAEVHFPSDRFHIHDNPEKTRTKLAELMETYDVIVMSGGVSKGKADYVPGALDELGVEKLFHRVAQRPGKPFWFGKSKDGVVVFALPGNPVSSFMCFTRYMKPWLLNQTKGNLSKPPTAMLQAAVTFTPPLTYLMQIKLSIQGDGSLTAFPIEGHGSGDLANLVHCNAFLEMPADRNEFQAGESFPVWKFREVII